MKKIIATIAFVLVSMASSAQLLYRVSGGQLAKPSYVVGTFHLASASFADKIVGIREALDATDQVYGEVKWDDMLNADSLKFLQRQMMLPDGKSLKSVMSAASYAKLNAYLKASMGVGLENAIVEQQMGHLLPASLTSQLAMMQYMTGHMGEFDPTNTIDSYFQTQAKTNNEPIGGLETIRFQSSVLFGSTPLKRQLALLDCFLNNQDYYASLSERMAKAYFAQDIDALQKVVDEKFSATCDATPEELDLLIYKRNADWAKKMPAIMAAKPTLFVVGAAHLSGERGLLELLRKAGFKVEAVK